MTAVAERNARRRANAGQKSMQYRRPWLYEKQADFLFTAARYSLVEATTKSGKTQGCLIWILELALLNGFDGWNGWWVAPVHGQAEIAYTRMKRMTKRLHELGLCKYNDSSKTVTLGNGAVLWFKSGEKPDNLYGEDVFAAVIDEASRMREGSWIAIRTTLTATRGPVRIIGNVKGRKNWFYSMARVAQAEMARGNPKYHYAKLTAWDAVDGGVLDRDEIEDARRVLSASPGAFEELYLAQPTEDGANPFDISAIAKCIMPAGMALGPTRAFGIDLAKSVDFTVLNGLNAAGQTSAFDRYQKPWEQTTGNIIDAVRDIPAYVDATGVGDPIVERLQKGRSNYTAFKFTSATKQQLMEGLALYISERAAAGEPFIYAGPGDVVKNELESFEYEYVGKEGRFTGVRYSAPPGMHDDTVCALALAVEQHRTLGRRASIGGSSITL